MLAIPNSYSYTIRDKSQFALISDSKNQPVLRVQPALALLLSLDALN